jgi:ABC-type multidrug transport system fused ATPase/permease subunit
MEIDRYQVNKRLYLLGMIALVLGFALILFSFVILPNLFWNLSYDVPSFILNMKNYIEYEYRWSANQAAWGLFLLFFFPGLILIIFSYFASNKIDKTIYHLYPEREERESLWNRFWGKTINDISLSIKIFMMILFVFVIAAILQWLLQIGPTP